MIEDKGYTNGKPYLVTRSEDEGYYSRSLYYLLPDGTRKKVTIMSADDTEEMRHKIGLALSTGEVRGRNWKRNRSV